MDHGWAMVVVPTLSHAEFVRNDHWKDATHFIIYWQYQYLRVVLTQAILIFKSMSERGGSDI